MPPTQQEERLVTVYTDIHYYFATPTVRPLLHRFDKASYFYIYYNRTDGSSRVEIANNPGAPEQDAFNGFLDNCRVINSHKFPTLVTLEVDGAARSLPSQDRHPDPDEWRLASGDPRQAGKNKYRLHTLDIYFWAEDDAKLVVGTLKNLLEPDQLDIAELEPEEQPDLAQSTRNEALSPLVQNLENVAISDPAYQNGKTRNSQNPAVNLPPPPPQPAQSVSPSKSMPQSSAGAQAAQNFAPMAYNPAAPAAPEPIAHREDTPPPPDDGQGTGLAAAARHDHVPYQQVQPGQPYAVGQPPSQPYQMDLPAHTGYQPGQPTSSSWTGAPPSATSPFSSPPQTHPSTLSYIPSNTSTSPTSPQHRQSTAAQHYTPDPAQLRAQHLAAGQPVSTPGAQFYNTLPQPTGSPYKPLQHVQPQYPDYLSASTPPRTSQFETSSSQPPPGHNFNYGAAAQQGMIPAQNPYDVHSQVYRPGEHDVPPPHGKRHSSSAKPAKESRVEKGEKKVSGWMSKLEKKVGL